MSKDELRLGISLRVLTNRFDLDIIKIVPATEYVGGNFIRIDEDAIDTLLKSNKWYLWKCTADTEGTAWVEFTYSLLDSTLITEITDLWELLGEAFMIEVKTVPVSHKQMLLHRTYLDMATSWGNMSYCVRKKVGCLVVKDKMIISDGYNGMPSKFPNICELESGETDPRVLHAEANAITKLAKSTNSGLGSTVYVTLSPCLECSKLLIQTEVKEVIFSHLYRDISGLVLLRDAGIHIQYVK